MPRGFPDHFGYALFPKYGSVTLEPVAVASIAQGDTVNVLDIIGKGQLFGGRLTIKLIDTDARILFGYTLDDQTVDLTTLRTLLEDSVLFENDVWPIRVVGLGYSPLQITLTFTRTWTFETGFTLTVKNNNDVNDMNVYGNLAFYNIL